MTQEHIPSRKFSGFVWALYRSVALCAEKSSEEDKLALEVWLPELKGAVQEAQRCLEDCKRVRGLVSLFKLPHIRILVFLGGRSKMAQVF